MVFHWSFSDSKSPQVSRTLLSNLAVLNNVVVWMVSTRPPTSKSSSPFNSPLLTVPNAPIIIIIILIIFGVFNTSISWWFSSEDGVKSKYPQVIRTFLTIQAYLNNAVFWMAYNRPLIPKSTSSCTKTLVTVPTALITIGISVTFIFHNCYRLSSRVLVLFSLFAFLQFEHVVSSQFGRLSFFFLVTMTRYGCLGEIRWSVYSYVSHYSYQTWMLLWTILISA